MVAQDHARLAGLLAFAVFFGAAWANHSRARADLESVKAGLERAKRAARSAGLVFGGAVVVAAVLAKLYINAHG